MLNWLSNLLKSYKSMGIPSLIHFIFLIILAFIMPFDIKLAKYFVALVIITGFVDYKSFSFKLLKVKKYKFYLFGFFFFSILLFASLFYSLNFENGVKRLERLISLFLLPALFFFRYRFYKDQVIKAIFKAFIFGNLIVCSIIIYGFISELVVNSTLQIYQDLSLFMHTSYHAFFFNLCIIFLLFEKKLVKSIVVKIILSIFFLVAIIVISSKAGLISLLFISLIGIILKFPSLKLSYKLFFIFLFLFEIFLLLTNKRMQSAYHSIGETIIEEDFSSYDGNQVRRALWELSIEAFKEKPWLGFGIGSSTDAMVMIQREKEISPGFYQLNRYRLNSHNQFLEVLVENGILGLLFLIFLILFPLFLSKSNTIFLFIILIVLNYMVESMLNRFVGVVSFSVFFPLMIIKYLRYNDPIFTAKDR